MGEEDEEGPSNSDSCMYFDEFASAHIDLDFATCIFPWSVLDWT